LQNGIGHRWNANLFEIPRLEIAAFIQRGDLDDPQMYTKPFTVKIPHYLLPDTDIFEMFCNENEKDRIHLGRQ